MQQHLRRLAPLASAGLLTLALAAAPSDAEDGKPQSRSDARGIDRCDYTLIDSSGLEWDLDDVSASVNDGGTPDDDRGGPSSLSDTYDGYGYAGVGEGDEERGGGSSDTDYENPDENGCTFEEGGREIVFPLDDDVNGTGVGIQRKVYVPASGPAFARWLDILSNPTGAPITVPYRWSGNYGEIDRVIASANGDTDVEAGERWASFRQGGGGDDQGDQASLWDGPDARDGWDSVFDATSNDLPGTPQGDGTDSAEDEVDLRYANVTIPAGGTAVFMHVEHQNRTPEGARDFAQANGDGTRAFFAGMSSAESSALRNWLADSDGDTRLDDADNCVTVANADQANLDGDAQGDVCDDDLDGDGLPNAVEAGFGSDPRNADSDGDGVRDGNDQCPSLGGTVNGCPTSTVNVLASTGRALPTGVSLDLSATRSGASASAKRAVAAQAGTTLVRVSGRIGLPRGVAASACSLGRVAVLVKRGTRTISTRVVNVRPDCTYRSNVRFKRNLGTRVRAKSYFFGSTGLVGRAAKAQSAAVK